MLSPVLAKIICMIVRHGGLNLRKFLIAWCPTGALRYRGGGGRTRVTYFAKEGVFFKTSTCPRFCKRRVLFCTQVRSMEVKLK